MAWIDGIAQICVVTSGLRTVVGAFADRLGIGPWKVWRFEAPRLFQMSVGGRPADYSMELALAYCGAMQIEVIQPISGDTVYARFLSAVSSGGVQHAMISSRARFGVSMRRLAYAGYAEVQSARVNTATAIGRVTIPRLPNRLVGSFATRFAFVGGREVLGTTIEVGAYPPGVSPLTAWKLGKADGIVEASRPPLFSTLGGLAIACSNVGAAARAWERAGFSPFVRGGSISGSTGDVGEESWASAGRPGSIELLGPSEPATGAPSHPGVAWVSANVARGALDDAIDELVAGGARELARFAHPLAGPTALLSHPAFGSTPIALRARR
jgi:hypothetical protein